MGLFKFTQSTCFWENVIWILRISHDTRSCNVCSLEAQHPTDGRITAGSLRLLSRGTMSSSATSADALLEEFLETIDVLPASLRRNFHLIATLDQASVRLQHSLSKAEYERLEEVKVIVAKARKNADLVKATKNEAADSEIRAIREELQGLGEEKVASTDQLLEILNGHMLALDNAISRADSMMQAKADGIVCPGAQVSVRVVQADGNVQWELGTLDHKHPVSKKWVIVDADDQTKTSEINDEDFKVLPDVYVNLTALPKYKKDQRVMALYPGTTVFYAAKVWTPPARKSNGKITDAVLIFDDDYDEAGKERKTFQIPAHTMYAITDEE